MLPPSYRSATRTLVGRSYNIQWLGRLCCTRTVLYSTPYCTVVDVLLYKYKYTKNNKQCYPEKQIVVFGGRFRSDCRGQLIVSCYWSDSPRKRFSVIYENDMLPFLPRCLIYFWYMISSYTNAGYASLLLCPTRFGTLFYVAVHSVPASPHTEYRLLCARYATPNQEIAKLLAVNATDASLPIHEVYVCFYVFSFVEIQ